MSIEARQRLVNAKSIFFQHDSQREDFLNVNLVRTETIALALALLERGHILEITSVRSDHHDDSALGKYAHARGAAFDCWPLAQHCARTYADAVSPQMTSFLLDALRSKWLAQVGLAGSADAPEVLAAIGYVSYPNDGHLFEDSGADHIHLSAIYPRTVNI